MIKRAQVYGMRCSGTNFLEAMLQKNFPKLRVLPTTFEADENFGWKHGLVGTPTRGFINGKWHEVKIIPLDWPKSSDSLLVVLYRNPITYLQSLHRSPHHAHEFYDVTFSDFIRKPWRAYYSEPGSESEPDIRKRLKWVKPKNSWESYNSVLHMREAKIAIFESFHYGFQHVAYLNYEALVKDPEECLRSLAECYKLKMVKKFATVGGYKGGDSQFSGTEYPPIEGADLQYLLKNIDWDKEESIGYSLKPGAQLLSNLDRVRQNPAQLISMHAKTRFYTTDPDGQSLLCKPSVRFAS